MKSSLNTYSGFATIMLIIMFTAFVEKLDPDLEKRISDLDNRVTLLEETIVDSNTIGTSDQESQYRQNWRQLREGMSQDNVQELLGQPNRIDGGRISIWHYPMGGSVFFSRGRVERWSEPF